MHRRRFLALFASLAVAPHLAAARQFEVEETPAPDQSAPRWEAIRYEHPDHDAAIRTIEVRQSLWDTPAAAGAAAGSLTANAGTPLPEGEFYHSEVLHWSPQIDVRDASEITGREWHTVVGVAAYTTEWTQIVVWQKRRLTVALVSGGSVDAVQDEAESMANLVLNRMPVPCGPKEPELLPTIDEVPAGMTLVWHASHTGVKHGTPEAERRMLAECTQVGEPG